MRWLQLITVIIVLTGCGAAHHSVNIQDEQAFGVDTKIVVGLVSNKTGETFDVDVEDLFRNALMAELEANNLLGQKESPGSLTMNASIIEYQKGSAFKRWLWPGYGSTILVVESQLIDKEGNVDATAQANRSVDFGGGYTAGAWKSIFKEVAKDLVTDLKNQSLE